MLTQGVTRHRMRQYVEGKDRLQCSNSLRSADQRQASYVQEEQRRQDDRTMTKK